MNTELYKAATSGKIDLFSKMEQDFFLQETLDKNSALHLAVKFNKKKFAKKIIGLHPPLLDQTNLKGDTPLHIAARMGRLKITKLLTSRSKNAKNREVEAHKELMRMVNLEKDTALHDAVRNGHIEIVKLLIREDTELTDFINDNGESPLFLAVDRKHFKIASHIFEAASACSSHPGRNNMNVLHAAVIRTSNIQQFNGFIDTWTRYVNNPYNLLHQLLRILKCASAPMVFLVRRVKDMLALVVLCSNSTDFMSAFIKKCPTTINEVDDFGWTPLHYAAYLCNSKAVQLLLKNDTDVAYMKDKEGKSALHIAAKEGHVIVMRHLIKFCPETCELRDDRGRTALHVVVESGKASAVKYALKTPGFESLINEQDKEGNRPLHLAAIHGLHGIVKMLVDDSRVDKGAMNKEGFTVIEIISKVELRRFEKASILKKLVQASALPSLEGVVIRENTKTENGEMKEQPQQVEMREPIENQEIKRTTLDRKGESIEGMKVKSLALEWKCDPAKSKDSKYHSLKDVANTHLLVATIIATVTFAAGFTMPGGYEGASQGVGHHLDEGMAVLSKKVAFKLFLIADTVAFCCSAATMLMHFWASMHENYIVALHFLRLASRLAHYSIFGMVTAFISGTHVVLDGSPGLATANLTIGCCFFMVFCIWFFG